MGALTVDGLLGPGGAIQAAMERYEHRPEQLALAREVERVLELQLEYHLDRQLKSLRFLRQMRV